MPNIKLNGELVFGISIILFFTITSFFGKYFIPLNPSVQHLSAAFQPPSWSHPFGTDYLGRDVFARTLEGGSVSIEVGVAAGLLTVVIGGLVGIFSAYYGYKVDITIQRIVDIILSIPLIVLALVLVALFGSSIALIVFAIGILTWPSLARITRAETLSLKERDFVYAEIVAGASGIHVVFRHLIPNQAKTILVYSGLAMSSATLIQAALSYLGFTGGSVSWGFDLYMAQQYIFNGSWWMTFFPGAAITLTSLGFYMISEGLRKMWR